MKKVLLGTSAIALAGAFASPAAAAEWEVRVGGYMEQYVAYGDPDVPGTSNNAAAPGPIGGDYSGIDSKQDSEIFFLPSITLDNGIKIGANIQLEGFQGGDQIDESYMQIKGSFGEILLGSENSAGYKMTYAAPDVSMLNVNSGSTTAFIPYSGTLTGPAPTSASAIVGADVFRGTLGTTFLENEGNNDAQRFTYFSPRFAGFQIGASYARDGRQDSNAQVDEDQELSNIIDIGANYVNSFGDFNIAVSGRWGTADAPAGDNDDPTLWSAGANLGYGGFTIGGSYAVQNKAETESGRSWDAGVSYETGPWGFSFTYFNGENQDDENATLNGIFVDEELEQFLLAARYKLAKGVALHAFGAYVDFDESLDDAGIAGGDDVDGFIIGTGVKINF
ncbi:MAG: porin [Paracoccaceae bacterium]|nr:porin [Paracoccaceae bacterium]